MPDRQTSRWANRAEGTRFPAVPASLPQGPFACPVGSGLCRGSIAVAVSQALVRGLDPDEFFFTPRFRLLPVHCTRSFKKLRFARPPAGFFLVLHAIPGNTDNAIPVGAGLPAMDSSTPRLSDSHALSLTAIAGKPAPTKSQLAGGGFTCAAFIRFTRVIVNDHRWRDRHVQEPACRRWTQVRRVCPVHTRYR